MVLPLASRNVDDNDGNESCYSEEEEEDEYDHYDRYRGFGGGYDDEYFEDRPCSVGSSVSTEGEDECDVYDEIEPDSPAGHISALLKNAVENVGEFTFGGAADDLPGHPGLQVQGFGLVTLPLVDPAQAERLAEYGRMAPFGLGSDTVLDPKVRRTWQFDKEQVRITNPAWNHGIAKLVSMAATRLGCPDMPLECHLYKLLLYGPGCHFVRHRDTEKEDRMFATLVIQLPSAHQGGELVVYQPDGTAVTHDFGAADGTSAFGHHYALHYADAEYELKSVNAGYRVALVYSICWPEGHRQADLLQSLPAQRQLATHLTSLAQAKRSFFFMLEYQYTPVSMGRLRLQALKGRIAMGFTLYLVQGTRNVQTGIDSMDHSEEFNPWIDVATGKQYESTNTNTDLGPLINPDGKTKNELWAAEKQRMSTRYTGNEGYEIHNRYSCYILVGVPRTLGPYAIVPYIGTTSISQVIDVESCSAAELASLIQCLPDPLKQPPLMCKQRVENGELDLSKRTTYVRTTPTDFSAKLLQIIVDRALEECIPTFFEAIPNQLSPAMISVYVEAMKAAALNQGTQSSPSARIWPAIRPRLIFALPNIQYPFMFGLQLVCQAMLADVPQDLWIDLLEPIRTLAAPANVFRSMPNTLTQAAQHAQVWRAVHGTVIMSLAASLAENRPLLVYPHATPHSVIFKLTLSLSVGAAKAKVEAAEFTELIELLKKCDPSKPATKPNKSTTVSSYYSSYGARDNVDIATLFTKSLDQLTAATRTPQLWQAVLPLVCRWLSVAVAVPRNRFAFAIALVDPLFGHHSQPTVVNPQLWQPILDAATSQPGFLTTTSMDAGAGLLLGYMKSSPSSRGAAAHVAKAMQHQVVWDHVSARISQALGKDQQRFETGLAILKAAQKDAKIPTERWSPLIPIVFFAQVPTPGGYSSGFSLTDDQLSLWSIVTVDHEHCAQVLERTVAAFIQANAPYLLKHALSAVITLMSRDPTIPPRTFLPLFMSRINWLQRQVPPSLRPHPQATLSSSSSSAWVISNASYPSDARIDQFLKTNQQTLHLTGFTGIADARTWARQHQPPTSALRQWLMVSAGGIGKRAYVQVQKLRVSVATSQASHVESAGSEDAQTHEYREELDRIKQVMQCVDAGQPVPMVV